MSNETQIVRPNTAQLDQVFTWLKRDYDEDNTGKGFWCNRDLIRRQFDSDEGCCLVVDGQVVAFSVWEQFNTKSAEILIVEVKREHRNQGLGKILIEHVLETLSAQGTYIVDGHCSPPQSLGFWEKVGFERKTDDFGEFPAMLKRLVPYLRPITQKPVPGPPTLSVWNCEPYEKGQMPPTWWFQLPSPNRNGVIELDLPILHPCKHDCYMELTVPNVCEYRGKVKHFKSAVRPPYGFLYVNEISPPDEETDGWHAINSNDQ